MAMQVDDPPAGEDSYDDIFDAFVRLVSQEDGEKFVDKDKLKPKEKKELEHALGYACRREDLATQCENPPISCGFVGNMAEGKSFMTNSLIKRGHADQPDDAFAKSLAKPKLGTGSGVTKFIGGYRHSDDVASVQIHLLPQMHCPPKKADQAAKDLRARVDAKIAEIDTLQGHEKDAAQAVLAKLKAEADDKEREVKSLAECETKLSDAGFKLIPQQGDDPAPCEVWEKSAASGAATDINTVYSQVPESVVQFTKYVLVLGTFPELKKHNVTLIDFSGIEPTCRQRALATQLVLNDLDLLWVFGNRGVLDSDIATSLVHARLFSREERTKCPLHLIMVDNLKGPLNQEEKRNALAWQNQNLDAYRSEQHGTWSGILDIAAPDSSPALEPLNQEQQDQARAAQDKGIFDFDLFDNFFTSNSSFGQVSCLIGRTQNDIAGFDFYDRIDEMIIRAQDQRREKMKYVFACDTRTDVETLSKVVRHNVPQSIQKTHKTWSTQWKTKMKQKKYEHIRYYEEDEKYLYVADKLDEDVLNTAFNACWNHLEAIADGDDVEPDDTSHATFVEFVDVIMSFFRLKQEAAVAIVKKSCSKTNKCLTVIEKYADKMKQYLESDKALGFMDKKQIESALRRDPNFQRLMDLIKCIKTVAPDTPVRFVPATRGNDHCNDVQELNQASLGDELTYDKLQEIWDKILKPFKAGTPQDTTLQDIMDLSEPFDEHFITFEEDTALLAKFPQQVDQVLKQLKDISHRLEKESEQVAPGGLHSANTNTLSLDSPYPELACFNDRGPDQRNGNQLRLPSKANQQEVEQNQSKTCELLALARAHLLPAYNIEIFIKGLMKKKAVRNFLDSSRKSPQLVPPTTPERKRVDELMSKGCSKSTLKLRKQDLDIKGGQDENRIYLFVNTAEKVVTIAYDASIEERIRTQSRNARVPPPGTLSSEDRVRDIVLHPIMIPSEPRNEPVGGSKPEWHCNLLDNEVCIQSSEKVDKSATLSRYRPVASAGQPSKKVKVSGPALNYLVLVFVRSSKMDEYRDSLDQMPNTIFVEMSGDMDEWQQAGSKPGVGRVRKLMSLVSEHFDMPCAYSIDDDMKMFLEFDAKTPGYRGWKHHDSALPRALVHLQQILNDECFPQSHSEVDSRQIKLSKVLADKLAQVEGLSMLQNPDPPHQPRHNPAVFQSSPAPADIDRLKSCCGVLHRYCKEAECRHIAALDPTELLQAHKDFMSLMDRLESCMRPFFLDFFKPNINAVRNMGEGLRELASEHHAHVGQIALSKMTDVNTSSGMGGYSRSFDSIKKKMIRATKPLTHRVCTVRHAVILTNVDAMHGVHCITDEALFEEPLSRPQRQEVMSIDGVKKGDYSDKDAVSVCRAGYKGEDAALIRFMLLQEQRIGGFTSAAFGYHHDEKQRTTAGHNDVPSVTESEGAVA